MIGAYCAIIRSMRSVDLDLDLLLPGGNACGGVSFIRCVYARFGTWSWLWMKSSTSPFSSRSDNLEGMKLASSQTR